MTDWLTQMRRLQALAERTLFLVGGAPRSGTTWVQLLANAHPEVSCHGEGLMQQHLRKPIAQMYETYAAAVDQKNNALFNGISRYSPPRGEDAEALLATAALLSLSAQSNKPAARAVGEKTPENVFLYPLLKRSFPRLKLVGMVRDPRDSLASAWKTFVAPRIPDPPSLDAFLKGAVGQIDQGLRHLKGLEAAFEQDCLILSYEALSASPHAEAARLFGFLGVSTSPALVDACVASTSFEALSGGRVRGDTADGAFLRHGRPGGWRAVFSPQQGEFITRALDWAFEEFHWNDQSPAQPQNNLHAAA